MTVPVDYNHPSGETITIGLARLKSSNANASSLSVNPGGPGGSATGLVFQVAAALEANITLFSEDMTQKYHIVGMDPRGIGMSTPVQCDPKLWNQRLSKFPKTEGEYQALVAHNKAIGESCAKLTGKLINHLDTIHVVKDLEMLRQAFRSSKLDYLGFSYGAQIGLQYAELYPENVGRFVLDGVVDHTLPEAATLLSESTTYDAVLNKFFEWCNTTSDCAFQGQDFPTIFDTLITNASLFPIPAPGCQVSGACLANVTGEDILTNVQGDQLAGQGGVTSPPYWPALSQAIKEASEGNATLLSTALATSIVTPDGSYGRLAIGCQDWLHESKNLSDILAKTRMASVFAPHTKGQCQTHDYQVNCIDWPAPVTNPQKMPSKNLQKAPAMMLR
jgi:pimeloyl-ACP methyl ester carboxylesterase